jgi:hypothetical protein
MSGDITVASLRDNAPIITMIKDRDDHWRRSKDISSFYCLFVHLAAIGVLYLEATHGRLEKIW